MWEFKSEINANNIDFAKDGINYRAVSNITIKWWVEPEIREWGVKSLIICIPDQTVEFMYEKEDANGDTYEEEIEIELQDVEYEHDARDGDFQLCPQDIMIDTERKKFTVGF